MIKVLESLGFKNHEARVYTYLAFEGPKKARDIADALRIYRRKAYRALKKMRHMGLIAVSGISPAVFSAISFDEILDRFMKDIIEDANRLESEKQEILAFWNLNVKKELKI